MTRYFPLSWIIVAALLLASVVMAFAQPFPQARTTVSVADTSVGAGATLIRAANAQRMSLTCKNTDAAVAFRIGDSTVSATKGLQINAGESVIVTNTDAVFGASVGAAVTVACTESLR